MRFLIDAQLPPGLCGWLEARGHEALHVNMFEHPSISDSTLADLAQAIGCVLITKDEDFVRLRLPDRFALLWLRCGNIGNRGLREWLEPQWADIDRRLASGERQIELT